MSSWILSVALKRSMSLGALPNNDHTKILEFRGRDGVKVPQCKMFKRPGKHFYTLSLCHIKCIHTCKDTHTLIHIWMELVDCSPSGRTTLAALANAGTGGLSAN